jgi:uncharacterized membrane protein
LGLAAGPLRFTLALLLVVAGVVVLVRYGRSLPPRWRVGLLALRSTVLALLALILLHPVLVLEAVAPLESFVAVLVDGSNSMTIADQAGAPAGGNEAADTRAGWVRSNLQPEGALRAALERRFKTRFFSFSQTAERIDDPSLVDFSGVQTRIDLGLASVAEEMDGVPLSGVIVLTDGAQTGGGEELTDQLLEFRARQIPVYPVGLGEQLWERDVELREVRVASRVLQGSALRAELLLEHSGATGEMVEVAALDGGQLIASEQIELGGPGQPTSATLTITPREAGPRALRFRVAPIAGELLEQNNERTVLVEVTGEPEKILYFEGEPRHEFSFLRRAVAKDEALQLVSMVRLAENRFSRLAVDSADELEGGFPATREELFAYRALVLGSIEASFFTYEQMRMLLDFVGKRGGGMLFLGGGNAFGEGGYAGTPVDEVVPIILPAPGEGSDFFTLMKVQPTPLGRRHPVVQLTSKDAGDDLWDRLPELSTRNAAVRLKPGASSLLVGTHADLADEQIVLAHQRYGRGKSVAMTAQDSWKWQMSMPLEDQTHELFWRQILRWLVSDVPNRIEVQPAARRVEVGTTVELIGRVRDEQFEDLNDAQVMAMVEAPSGVVQEVPLEWSVREDGLYRGQLDVAERGMHRVQLRARRGGSELGNAVAFVEGADLGEEFFRSGRRDDLLTQIADETGGRVYRPNQIEALVERLTYSQQGVTVREERDLWNAPAIYLLLVGLLLAEWVMRRVGGLT